MEPNTTTPKTMGTKKDAILVELRGGAKRGNLVTTAKKAGINKSHLSRIENGRINKPRRSTINKLAKALSTDPEKLNDYFRSRSGSTLAGQTRLPLDGTNLGAQTVEGDLLVALILRGIVSPAKEREMFRLASAA